MIQLRSDPVAAVPADVDRIVSGYCSAWNERDPRRRLQRLQSIWHENGTFENPSVHLRGLRDLDTHIGALHAHCDGWRFVVVDVTTHGRHFLLAWKLLDSTGCERLAGHDVGECTADRRLGRVVSLWRSGAAAG